MTVADRLLRILDLAPAGKVLLGTDGYDQPELFWFGALVLRDAWREVARSLEVAGARKTWVQEVGSMIFEENARAARDQGGVRSPEGRVR